jgi:F0F1-type ATP synthase membrane subunit b/b'
MKQYYIFINEERKGPLTFVELELENISNETLVWYDGIPEWKKANEIEELKELFKATPPPINPVSKIPPLPISKKNSLPEEDSEPSTILGLSKKIFYGIAVVVIIGTVGFYNYESNENQRIQQIDNRIDQQEQIEAQRRKEAVDRRLVEIQNLVAQNQQTLEKAKRHLNDVTGFKLLRTSSERNEQITAAQNDIEAINGQIRSLEEEFKSLSQ